MDGSRLAQRTDRIDEGCFERGQVGNIRKLRLPILPP